MPKFLGVTRAPHDEQIEKGQPAKLRTTPKIGILLANLGTPNAPTAKALRPYLREFLSDIRVIEAPRLVWFFVLNLKILPFRPKKSAELYKKVWTDEGSPLLLNSNRQKDALHKLLKEKFGEEVLVEVGMRYGHPSIQKALRKLREDGAQKILLLPMYAQYSATTVGSVFDATVDELKTWRWVPELRTMMNYCDDPQYIKALANSVREHWEKEGKAEKLVMSYHGIPKSYFDSGDPYHCFCHKTSRLLAEELGLNKEDYIVSFQSLFGKAEWIKPYTDKTIEGLAKDGVKSLEVICPGFSSDCLETLEEIDGENREIFLEAGGEKFSYIPALNYRDDFIEALANLCTKNTQGWF